MGAGGHNDGAIDLGLGGIDGGEPLVRPDWAVIVERLVQLGISVVLISNGLRMGAQVVDRLVSLGVKGVSLSLDGDRTVHDRIRVPAHGSASTYDAVIAALKRVVASHLRSAVITQIHRGNIDSLARMHEELVSLGVQVWQLQICMPLGRLLKYREEYLIEPEQTRIFGGRRVPTTAHPRA